MRLFKSLYERIRVDISQVSIKEKNMDLLKKWIVAMRREDFAPTSYSRICGEHFLPTDYYHSTSNFLRKDAVPSVFNFPLHLQKESAPPRRELKRKMPCEIDPPKGPPPPPPSAKEPKSPSKEQLKSEIVQLKREVKTLRQKVKRKVTKIGSLSNLIDDLKEKALIDESTVTVLKNKFSGTTLELIKNQLLNQEKDPKGRRYEEEVKKFALTLNFYSPRAYDYIRTVFSLPHARSLSKWTSSMECQPGIFSDALLSIGESIITNPDHADCALLCDAMSIKSSVLKCLFRDTDITRSQ